MGTNLAEFEFSAEFSGDFLGDPSRASAFDDYFREEFEQRHPGWQTRLGKTKSQGEPDDDRYLLTGNVPEAESHPEAEEKVRHLVDQVIQGLKSKHPNLHVPHPHIRVWSRGAAAGSGRLDRGDQLRQ